ncbi:MAG: nucleotidyl transferase AbiEii/AbiGii toxin family protein [Candidatus Micrarchaeota archaeon]|nr:nucleotidyl transferase AbiEii/AbiGii toxin family protein [Candidatus Micrarchaeota archaeon]
MKIPLANRLKKRLHVETAALQDEMIDLVYAIEENAVLHGGTAIWRCYNGNRFSEDLDFYFPVGEDFEQKLITKLKERNLQLLKYKKTENVLFAKISDGNVEVRLEVNSTYKYINAITKPYEKIDGSYIDIFTLSVEDFVIEKIAAYQSRKLIRDIYDIYHLSRYVEKNELVKEPIRNFLGKIEKPLDEENLKAIVYTGAVPSFKQMLDAIRTRF